MFNRPSGRATAAACALAFALSASAAGCASSQKKKLSDEQRAQRLAEIARGALLEGDATGALQNLALAERHDPKRAEIYHLKAIAYHAKNDLKNALIEGKKAVTLDPAVNEANNSYGKILLDAGKYHEAEVYLSKAAQDPLFRDAHKASTNLGILHYRLGDYAQAEKNLQKAIEQSPATACVAHYYQGHVELKTNRLKDAVKSYEKATHHLCSGFVDAHLALGIAYERNKQYTQARKKFLDIRQSFPNSKVADQAMDRLRYLP